MGKIIRLILEEVIMSDRHMSDGQMYSILQVFFNTEKISLNWRLDSTVTDYVLLFFVVPSGKSFIYIKNKRGPNTDPYAKLSIRPAFILDIYNDLRDGIMLICKISADDTLHFSKIIDTRNYQNTLNSDIKSIKIELTKQKCSLILI